MNRRDLLKGLGVLPFAGALGCHHKWPPSPIPSHIYTLQVLIEGAFALVLQRQSNTILAFVPKPPADQPDLDHHLYFNDPINARAPGKYRFKLSARGLKPDSPQYPDPYIDRGFNDFLDQTEDWHLPPSLVVLELPFPQSITFSGRPLTSTFVDGHTGLMPTSRILEYYVKDPEFVKMSCPELKDHCPPSPHCPPGMLRYFFGVAPVMDSQDHAKGFFNFTVKTAFPGLFSKYELKDIERKHSVGGDRPPKDGTAPGGSQDQPTGRPPHMTPAIYDEASQEARLVTVASTVDCQSGGLTVNTRTLPS